MKQKYNLKSQHEKDEKQDLNIQFAKQVQRQNFKNPSSKTVMDILILSHTVTLLMGSRGVMMGA